MPAVKAMQVSRAARAKTAPRDSDEKSRISVRSTMAAVYSAAITAARVHLFEQLLATIEVGF